MLHELDGVEDRSRAEGEGQVDWARARACPTASDSAPGPDWLGLRARGGEPGLDFERARNLAGLRRCVRNLAVQRPPSAGRAPTARQSPLRLRSKTIRCQVVSGHGRRRAWSFAWRRPCA